MKITQKKCNEMAARLLRVAKNKHAKYVRDWTKNPDDSEDFIKEMLAMFDKDLQTMILAAKHIKSRKLAHACKIFYDVDTHVREDIPTSVYDWVMDAADPNDGIGR